MTSHIIRTAVAIAALFAAGTALGGPAHADPPSGGTTTVVMHLPGPLPPPSRSGPDESYKPPVARITEQLGDGAGVDRDGTDGYIDRDGTDGVISGPLMVAVPQYRAAPAPLAAHTELLP